MIEDSLLQDFYDALNAAMERAAERYDFASVARFFVAHQSLDNILLHRAELQHQVQQVVVNHQRQSLGPYTFEVPEGTPDHAIPHEFYVVSTVSGKRLVTIRNDRWDAAGAVADDADALALVNNWSDMEFVLNLMGAL